MIADLSQDVPDEIKDEVNSLLDELGRKSHAIPYYALFRADGTFHIVGEGPMTQSGMLDGLRKGLGLANENAAAATTVGPPSGPVGFQY